jgi:hypothetical protein
MRDWRYSSTTTILDLGTNVSDQLHAPEALPPREIAVGTHGLGGWMDPKAGLDDVKKRIVLPVQGIETRLFA